MNDLIVITGFCGAGKDTMAQILVDEFGYIKLSFASVLKDIVAILFDWNREMLEGLTEEHRKQREQIDIWWSNRLNIENLTPRLMLQIIGTQVFRNNFHNDIWIAILERRLLKYKKVVITDCRFQNEYEMLKKYNAKFVVIQRNDNPEWFNDLQNNKIQKPPIDIHESNWQWIKFGIKNIIFNIGDKEQLKNKIINFKDLKF